MTGAVSMVERGWPDLRPTVCNSTTGIPNAEPSTLAVGEMDDGPVQLAHGLQADIGQVLLQVHAVTLEHDDPANHEGPTPGQARPGPGRHSAGHLDRRRPTSARIAAEPDVHAGHGDA